MSMISSLIKRLNTCRKYVYNPCSDPREVDDLLKEAADTIEALSVKCRDEWISVGDRMPEEVENG